MIFKRGSEGGRREQMLCSFFGETNEGSESEHPSIRCFGLKAGRLFFINLFRGNLFFSLSL